MSILVPIICFPVLAISALFYMKQSLPDVVQCYMEKATFSGLKVGITVLTKVVKKTTEARSGYMWVHRQKTPFFLTVYMDKCLRVNPMDVGVNISHLHDSIVVERATVTHKDIVYDVTDMVDYLWTCGDGLTCEFFLQKVLGYESVLVSPDDDLTLRVRYAGHSDKIKRVPYQVYTVQYQASSSTSVSFPPYPSSSVPKKGLGSTKVLSAIVAGKSSCFVEARESAGLRGKFYVDVKDDSVKKNVVTFIEEDTTILEDLPVLVKTSRGEVQCNL